MVGFTEKIHLKEKAEEDIYFAELDRKLIKALHERNKKASGTDKKPVNNIEFPKIAAEKNED